MNKFIAKVYRKAAKIKIDEGHESAPLDKFIDMSYLGIAKYRNVDISSITYRFPIIHHIFLMLRKQRHLTAWASDISPSVAEVRGSTHRGMMPRAYRDGLEVAVSGNRAITLDNSLVAALNLAERATEC